jgi:hypothetical protein
MPKINFRNPGSPTRSGGEHGSQLLDQAVSAYRSALEVYTQDDLPQDWADTQNNLGNALSEPGTRSGGEQGRQLAHDPPGCENIR